MYNFAGFKEKVREHEEHFRRELETLRTGRATPSVLDGVNVEFYGAQNKISHIAAISIEDAKTLRISPWDRGALKPIETALATANIGVSISPDADGLRVIFPDLTAERRRVLEKILGDKHEEARVAIKREREAVWSDISQKERDGEISEDEKFKSKDDLQTIIDESNARLEAVTKKKVAEISQ